MSARNNPLHGLIQEAEHDPAVLGLMLTGSRGKEFATPYSDYDVVLIVSDDALATYQARFPRERQATLDVTVIALSAFADYAAWGSSGDWDRYSFTRVTVLLDKPGTIQQLVDEKGVVPPEFRLPLLRGALDAYINSVYRSVKCFRNENYLGAHLQAVDSLQHALTVIFALEGRHRPFCDYLERELTAYPLRDFPLPKDEFLALLKAILADGNLVAQQRLLVIIEPACRQAGCGDVLDAWGADLDWMKTYRPDRQQ
ncbi:MAG TPA: hypothetical protein VFU78_15295 [Thermomicrobiales bacterium]|nr:hypothetical protein [Thermomicrobiales bacterium]